MQTLAAWRRGVGQSLLVLTLGIGVTTPLQAARIDVDSATPYMGIGINALTYYDGAYAMADAVRESQFRSMSWGEDVGADATGAPSQDFILIMSSLLMKDGTYHLVFKGQADLSVAGIPADGSGNRPYISNQQYDAATNTTTADVIYSTTVRDNTWIVFSNTRRTAASTSSDGVTEVHLWRPGYATDGSVVFTTEFLTAMKKFHLIRGMDFVSANSNPSVAWSERTTMDHLGMVDSHGQPWELMVLLANATNKDIWLNVPVKANDDYIKKLAQLLRYGSDGQNPYTSVQANPVYPPLKAGLRVYVEYGNELWNSGPGFYGFGWALDFANANRTTTRHPINYDGVVTDDMYLALRRWIAYRSASISLTFRSVFGASKMMSTVRPILASQVGNGNVYLSEGLKWAEGFYGQVRTTTPVNKVARSVSDLWFGAGGAAYYESDTEPSDTSAATMRAYFAGLPNANFAKNTAIDATWVRGYGLKSVAYEGGPGPGGSPLGSISAPANLAATYNADGRMKAAMIRAQNIYHENGGQLLSYYVYSSSAPWDFVNDKTLNSVADTSTVKLKAVDYIRTHEKPSSTLGTTLPASITLHDTDRGIIMESGAGWGYDSTAYRFSPGIDAGHSEFGLIPVRSDTEASYQVRVSTYDAPEGGTLVLEAEGKQVGQWSLPASNSGVAVLSEPITVTLPAGLSILRLRATNGTIWVKDLSFQ